MSHNAGLQRSIFSTQPTPEAAGFSRSRLERLSEVLRADVAAGTIPGAVALIARNGQLAYHQAFGYAERATLRTMQPTTVFRIASMTKPVTVVAALMLMERGKLLLTDPVWRYLPALRDVQVGVEEVDSETSQRRLTLKQARRPMTIQDLMRHTAGFTYGQFGDSLVQRAYRNAHVVDNQQNNAELVAKLAKLPLAHQPGTTFEYGMSTDVLAAVVEAVSELPLDRFFSEHITGPLQMTDTRFGMPHDEADRLAEPQRDALPGQVRPWCPTTRLARRSGSPEAVDSCPPLRTTRPSPKCC
jgi:CubicO group peptidase (beta-lactamase class C family)